MKLALAAASAVLLSASAFVPTAAQADDPILVQSHSAADRAFAEGVTRHLNTGLDRALRQLPDRETDVYGVSAVSFAVDGDGRVSDLAMAHRSGNTALDRTARIVIRRLQFDAATRPYRASRVRAYMIVAPDEPTRDRLSAKVQAIEADRRADPKGSGTELVLAIAPAGKS